MFELSGVKEVLVLDVFDLDINLLYAETKESVTVRLHEYSKSELVAFAEQNEIPYRKNASRLVLIETIADFVYDVGRFRRIAGRP